MLVLGVGSQERRGKGEQGEEFEEAHFAVGLGIRSGVLSMILLWKRLEKMRQWLWTNNSGGEDL